MSHAAAEKLFAQVKAVNEALFDHSAFTQSELSAFFSANESFGRRNVFAEMGPATEQVRVVSERMALPIDTASLDASIRQSMYDQSQRLAGLYSLCLCVRVSQRAFVFFFFAHAPAVSKTLDAGPTVHLHRIQQIEVPY